MATEYHILTDETGQEIVEKLQDLVSAVGGSSSEVVEYGVRHLKGASSAALERVTRVNGVISAWDIDFTPNEGSISDNPFDYIELFAPPIYADAGGNNFSRFAKFYHGKQTIGDYEYEWVCSKKLYTFYTAPRAFYRNGVEYWDYRDIGCYEGAEETINGTTHLVSKPGKVLAKTITRTVAEEEAEAWNTTLGVDTTKEFYSITLLSEITEILQPLLLILFGTRSSQTIYCGVCGVDTSEYSVAKAETSATRILIATSDFDSVDAFTEQFPAGCCVQIYDDDNTYYRRVTASGSVTVSSTTYYYMTIDTALTTNTGMMVWRLWNATGETDAIAATHGTLSNDGTHSFKVFNIENIYGNIWKHILDCTIYNYTPYVCTDIENWTDTTTPASNSYFVAASYTVSKSSGYVKELDYDASHPDCVFPVSVGGSDSTYYCDYYWIASGTKTVFYGGNYGDGSRDGLFYWVLNYDVGGSVFYIGARLSHGALKSGA